MVRRTLHVAILVENVYQDQEVWYPYFRLIEAGMKVTVAGPKRGTYTSKFGYPMTATASVAQLSASTLDGLIIPGGYAPDFLRRYPAVTRLVKAMDRQRKVIGAICHAGWVLCTADVLRGKTATGFFAIKADLVNAGARYVDREVVRDGHLITSRKPEDLPAFMRTILDALHAPSTPRRR